MDNLFFYSGGIFSGKFIATSCALIDVFSGCNIAHSDLDLGHFGEYNLFVYSIFICLFIYLFHWCFTQYLRIFYRYDGHHYGGKKPSTIRGLPTLW